MKPDFSLFKSFGIELEYMIVKKDTLDVFPAADEVLYAINGNYNSDADAGKLEWSNELALHVIELKTKGAAKTITTLSDDFHYDLIRINKILEEKNAMLMPGAIHPWMDPYKEMKLWPHEHSPVYEAYNRIFDCRGHGWANLQSIHLNLPFTNDEEFGRLHAAIRVILPILPALTASSPIAGGNFTGYKDFRLETYRKNQQKVPSITGKVIPEAIFSTGEYHDKILKPMYREIATFDPGGELQYEWLNSRGAIARFDRNTIEIRTMDSQECPKAEIGIAWLVMWLTRSLMEEKWASFSYLKSLPTEGLHTIWMDAIRSAENTVVADKDFLKAFGWNSGNCHMHLLWQYIHGEAVKEGFSTGTSAIETIMEKGSLATRILNALGDDLSHEKLLKVFMDLCACITKNEMLP